MKTVTDSGHTHAQLRDRYTRRLVDEGMLPAKAREIAAAWVSEYDILYEVPDWFAVPDELHLEWSAGGEALNEILLCDREFAYFTVDSRCCRRLKRKLKPDVNAWLDFLQSLNAIDAWSWPEELEMRNPVLDGVRWSAVVVAGERSLRSRGYHVYPPGTTPGREPDAPVWVEFCLAASRLAEGEPFGGYALDPSERPHRIS